MSRVKVGNKWMNTPKGDERCNCSKVTTYKVPIGTPSKDVTRILEKGDYKNKLTAISLVGRAADL